MNDNQEIMDDDQEFYFRTTLTHAEQEERFGWCMCDNGRGHMSEGCEDD